jgi:hypothetical protein
MESREQQQVHPEGSKRKRGKVFMVRISLTQPPVEIEQIASHFLSISTPSPRIFGLDIQAKPLRDLSTR